MFRKLLVLSAVIALAAGFAQAAFADDAAAPAATPAATAAAPMAAATPAVSGVAASAASAALGTGSSESSGPSIKVGGIIKIWIYDRVNGVGKVTAPATGPGQMDLQRNVGTLFQEFDLSINAKLNDLVSFVVEPKWSASAGATPKLGQTTTATSTGIAANDMGHGVAEMLLNLPADVQLEAGQLRPLFSMDYGAEMFFDEEMNTGKATHELMVVEDFGLGANKTFNFGDLSLPTYLYVMNGPAADYAFENNNQPDVMLHVEPRYGPVELYGSMLLSRYDAKELDADIRWLGGINFRLGGLTVRSEFSREKRERYISQGQDYNAEGYYVKVFYRVLPWLQFMIHHDSALEDTATSKTPADPKVRYITNTPGMEINLSDSTILQVNCDIGDWRTEDGTKTTVFTRPNVAIRASF